MSSVFKVIITLQNAYGWFQTLPHEPIICLCKKQSLKYKYNVVLLSSSPEPGAALLPFTPAREELCGVKQCLLQKCPLNLLGIEAHFCSKYLFLLTQMGLLTEGLQSPGGFESQGIVRWKCWKALVKLPEKHTETAEGGEDPRLVPVRHVARKE